MIANKLYATKEAVTVSYGNKDYRIQNDRGYRHIVVYIKGVRKKIPVLETVNDWCFNYVFGGLYERYPCPAIDYFIYRHRLGNRVTANQYKANFNIKNNTHARME